MIELYEYASPVYAPRAVAKYGVLILVFPFWCVVHKLYEYVSPVNKARVVDPLSSILNV